MKHLRRPIFGFITLLSLLVCVAASVLWARSYRRGGDSAEFTHRGARWQVRTSRGGIRMDNEPQRRMELAPINSEGDRLIDELVRVDKRLVRLGERYAGADPPPGPPAEGLRRLYERQQDIVGELEALSQKAKGMRLSPAAAHAAPRALPVCTFAAGALPAAWLARAAMHRHRRRRRRSSNLCRACGYDLRATPERCPECGTAVTPAGVKP